MRIGALLDDISSTRSSTTRQSQVLDEIEQALAMACTSSDKEGQLDAFLMLQDAFETNVASRLVAVISSWLPLLQYRAGDQCQCNASGPNLEATILNIVRVLSILQGISLLHKPSQLFLGRRWCLELFLDLLALSRQLHQSADFSTRQEIISSLASAVLDILPCILVDTPESIRHFEQASGLEIVVRTLKRASVPREIRMKCLEFLYFYLLPEDGIIPIGPTLPLSEIPSQPKLETTSDGWEISSGRSDSSEETYMPNPKVAELHLLKQELSFVPITPKKPLQVAPQRTGSPLERKGRRSPTRTLQAQPPNHAPSEQSIGRTHESAAQRTPYRRHMREESAATLVGSQTDPRSLTNSREPLLGTPTSLHLRERETPKSTGSDTESSNYRRAISSKSHIRDRSITGETLVARQTVNLREERKSKGFKSDEETAAFAMDSEKPKTGDDLLRSTKEKTLLLENYLGNVESLIAGMKKAGIWGLG
ncbi:hypothetical protein FS842_005339 [Serendipita sp. 407]|nr:hypothetical protein FS842_005339 [Serendipita sp. 407]